MPSFKHFTPFVTQTPSWHSEQEISIQKKRVNGSSFSLLDNNGGITRGLVGGGVFSLSLSNNKSIKN